MPVDINADRQRSLPIVCDRAQCDAGAGAAVQPNHYRNRGERRRSGGELLRRYNDAPDAQRLGRDRQAHTGRNAVEYEGEETAHQRAETQRHHNCRDHWPGREPPHKRGVEAQAERHHRERREQHRAERPELEPVRAETRS